jgi:single-stranded-DNA-specific exonuclease
MPETKEKRWRLAPRIPPSIQNKLHEYHPIMAQVLYNRNLEDSASAIAFLDGAMPEVSSFDMADMSKAVTRIRQAVRNGEMIAVYGDFDTDGVTSTALLVQTLQSIGAVVEPYIPHRVEDGYGLNSGTLVQMAQDGVGLIITVDCGIRAVQEVADATSYGLDIIVTDHHSVGEDLPSALAIINPKRADCPTSEDMLAGVGVAYHLADALLRAAEAAGEPVSIQQDDLLDLVAIGTVADLAPMNRLENRALVRRGLEVLNTARRPGLYALMDVVGLRPGKIKASSIGFALGPRLNAAGRLESASSSYELLMTTDYNQAMNLAQELNELNVRRQDETRMAQAKARELAILDLDLKELPIIFAVDQAFLPGIVGLVAGRLAEEFYRPAVVVEQGKDGESRGSCRSIPEFDIVRALDRCADLLVRHGGHSQAAGFTVRNENLFALRDRLFELAQDSLRDQDLRPTLDIDAEVPLEWITMDLAAELARLEPLGHQNPAPVFATHDLLVLDSRRVGKDGAHLKLTVGESGFRVDAIAFRLGELANDLPRRIDVAYHLEINEWNGRQRVQLNIKDIRPAGFG